MKPTTPQARQPPLGVTPLEDRVLAASLARPDFVLPVPKAESIPAHSAPASKGSGVGDTGGGGVTIVRTNHNETFVRRRRGKR